MSEKVELIPHKVISESHFLEPAVIFKSTHIISCISYCAFLFLSHLSQRNNNNDPSMGWGSFVSTIHLIR